MPVSTTEISTEEGRLPMVWWEQPKAASELGIVLPGRWFGCAPPPTAYATLALQALGADVAWVNYAYDRDPGFERLDAAVQQDRLFHDARAGVKAALTRRSVDHRPSSCRPSARRAAVFRSALRWGIETGVTWGI